MAEDGQWFLGGEDFMWNSAIERGFTQLERIMVTDKGEYKIHTLKYGESEDSKFSVSSNDSDLLINMN